MKKYIFLVLISVLFSCEKYESEAPSSDDIIIKPLNQYSELPIIIESETYLTLYCDINDDGIWDYNNVMNTKNYGLGTFNAGEHPSPIVFKANSNIKNIKILLVNDLGLKFEKNYSLNVNAQNDSKYGTMVDTRDNKTYRTVVIGNQVWMAENLAYDIGEGCWAYDNNEDNVATYGRLYTLNASLSACPSGWHLPSDDEWKQLERYLGMSEADIETKGTAFNRGTIEGDLLKVGGSSGLNILLGGMFSEYYGNVYGGINEFAAYWTSTGSQDWAEFRLFERNYSGIRYSGWVGYDGFYVRCIKD